MHVHIRIHHWVIWWFWLGVAFTGVSLLNVLVRDLPRTEDKVVAAVSALFWIVGGIFCYAIEGVRIEPPPDRTGKRAELLPGFPDFISHPRP